MCYSLTGHEQTVISNFKKNHKHICHYCNKDIIQNEDLTVDHLTPVSRGGKTEDNNLVICCHSCNHEKSNMTEKEYMDFLEDKNNIEVNDESIKQMDEMINTYRNVIKNYKDTCDDVENKRKDKNALENVIKTEKCNASEGYNLYRDLRNLLIEIDMLDFKRQNLVAMYNHTCDGIKRLETIRKNTLERLIKNMRADKLKKVS